MDARRVGDQDPFQLLVLQFVQGEIEFARQLEQIPDQGQHVTGQVLADAVRGVRDLFQQFVLFDHAVRLQDIAQPLGGQDAVGERGAERFVSGGDEHVVGRRRRSEIGQRPRSAFIWVNIFLDMLAVGVENGLAHWHRACRCWFFCDRWAAPAPGRASGRRPDGPHSARGPGRVAACRPLSLRGVRSRQFSFCTGHTPVSCAFQRGLPCPLNATQDWSLSRSSLPLLGERHRAVVVQVDARHLEAQATVDPAVDLPGDEGHLVVRPGAGGNDLSHALPPNRSRLFSF